MKSKINMKSSNDLDEITTYLMRYHRLLESELARQTLALDKLDSESTKYDKILIKKSDTQKEMERVKTLYKELKNI